MMSSTPAAIPPATTATGTPSSEAECQGGDKELAGHRKLLNDYFDIIIYKVLQISLR